MSNEIKTEFETYVKELAETICKEIYLKDLKSVCQTYIDQIEDCRRLYEEHTEKSHELQESVDKQRDSLNSIHREIGEKLTEVNGTIKENQGEYVKLLDKYSTTVTELNGEMQEEFIKKFTDAVRASKREWKKEITSCSKLLKDTFEGVITKENLEVYIGQMKECSDHIAEGLAWMKDGYQEVFFVYTDKLMKHSEEDKKSIRNIVNETVQTVLGDFSGKVEENLRVQTEMLDTRMLDKAERKSLMDGMENLRGQMEEMQHMYEKKLTKFVKLLEQEEIMRQKTERQGKQERKFVCYVSFANTAFVLAAMLVLVLTKPWSVGSDVLAAAGLAGVLVMYISLVFLVRKKVYMPNEKKR